MVSSQKPDLRHYRSTEKDSPQEGIMFWRLAGELRRPGELSELIGLTWKGVLAEVEGSRRKSVPDRSSCCCGHRPARQSEAMTLHQTHGGSVQLVHTPAGDPALCR